MKIYRYPIYGALATAVVYAFHRFIESAWTFPVLAAAVVLNLLALAWKASRWRGYKPVRYGFVGAILVVLGTLTEGAEDLVPFGVLTLISVSLWTAWPPKNPGEKPPCCQ